MIKTFSKTLANHIIVFRSFVHYIIVCAQTDHTSDSDDTFVQTDHTSDSDDTFVQIDDTYDSDDAFVKINDASASDDTFKKSNRKANKGKWKT